MNEESQKESVAARPQITRIDPEKVPQNSERPLSVYGQNFSPSSYVFVDARVPVKRYISDSHLEADLTTQDTGSLGKLLIKIHDSGTGDVSNEVLLEVV